MEQLEYSIDIRAARSKVWQILWDDATYRDWTSAFAAGSYAVSDWNEGSRIQFIDPGSGDGMVAVIETKTPDEQMCFRHVSELRNGEEHPFPDDAVGRERYTLTTTDDGTRLAVRLDAPAEYRQMFDDKFPKALRRVKELAEA